MRIATVSNVQEYGHFLNVYRRLVKIGKQLHRIYENQCNGYEYKGMDKKENNLRALADSLANDISMIAYHQTDPRGCALYLIDESMDSSTYSNGIAVI